MYREREYIAHHWQTETQSRSGVPGVGEAYGLDGWERSLRFFKKKYMSILRW